MNKIKWKVIKDKGVTTYLYQDYKIVKYSNKDYSTYIKDKIDGIYQYQMTWLRLRDAKNSLI